MSVTLYSREINSGKISNRNKLRNVHAVGVNCFVLVCYTGLPEPFSRISQQNNSRFLWIKSTLATRYDGLWNFAAKAPPRLQGRWTCTFIPFTICWNVKILTFTDLWNFQRCSIMIFCKQHGSRLPQHLIGAKSILMMIKLW